MVLNTIYPDVIVLGVGRSGTSFVAGILHNHFGVCLGHYSSKLDFNEYYECQTMFGITIKLCGRFGCGRDPDEMRHVDKWLELYTKEHKDCATSEACGKKLYGIKVKHMCWITPNQLRALRPKLIVRTWRDPESSATSFYELNKERRHGKGLPYWRNLVDAGEEALQNLERKVNDIPFLTINIPMRNTRRMPEEEVIELLQPCMEKLEDGEEYQYNLF